MQSSISSIILNGLEKRVAVLQSAVPAARSPVHGWLKAVRQATGMKQTQVALKMGITRQAYADLELAEGRGSISIGSLQRAAAALGCELAHFLVPRENGAQTFTQLAQSHDPNYHHLQATEHSMALEGQAVGDLPRKAKKRK